MEKLLLKKEKREALREAVKALPPIQGKILILHAGYEYSFVEIADILGLTPFMARTRYDKALESLKDNESLQAYFLSEGDSFCLK